MFDSCWLFLHRVNSHHYLYHHQNMDPRYASSKEKEPVRKVRILLRASLETAIGKTRGFSLLANVNSKKIPWSYPWSETKKTPFGAHLWMYFSLVDRLCFKLFLFLTVLLNMTFLKMGFIVVQCENETSMSVVNEKKVIGTMWKEGTTVDISTGTIKQWLSGHL